MAPIASPATMDPSPASSSSPPGTVPTPVNMPVTTAAAASTAASSRDPGGTDQASSAAATVTDTTSASASATPDPVGAMTTAPPPGGVSVNNCTQLVRDVSTGVIFCNDTTARGGGGSQGSGRNNQAGGAGDAGLVMAIVVSAVLIICCIGGAVLFRLYLHEKERNDRNDRASRQLHTNPMFEHGRGRGGGHSGDHARCDRCNARTAFCICDEADARRRSMGPGMTMGGSVATGSTPRAQVPLPHAVSPGTVVTLPRARAPSPVTLPRARAPSPVTATRNTKWLEGSSPSHVLHHPSSGAGTGRSEGIRTVVPAAATPALRAGTALRSPVNDSEAVFRRRAEHQLQQEQVSSPQPTYFTQLNSGGRHGATPEPGMGTYDSPYKTPRSPPPPAGGRAAVFSSNPHRRNPLYPGAAAPSMHAQPLAGGSETAADFVSPYATDSEAVFRRGAAQRASQA